MLSIGLGHYLTLAAIIFIIGIVGLTILAQYIGIYVAFIFGLGIVILVIRQDLKDKKNNKEE